MSPPLSLSLQVLVLYVADLHAQLRAHPELFWHGGKERIEEAGGFARVAAAIQRIRAERGGEVLVLDAGDTSKGAPWARASRPCCAPSRCSEPWPRWPGWNENTK